MKKEFIRDFYGRILGSIETDTNGNKVAKDFYGRRLGTYDKKSNMTRDFYGRIIAKGDQTAGLIWSNKK